MRGTRIWTRRSGMFEGIIPAYAGNTLPWISAARGGRDHPRVCGEHLMNDAKNKVPSGSSPRMRGTPMACFTFRAQSGIIPAYAGNTRISATLLVVRKDHPRVCGEHFRQPLHAVPLPGSSPRMRGTLHFDSAQGDAPGIIPAYAGNTRVIPYIVEQTWDHPRVCGEHSVLESQSRSQLGSSPRMRGTPDLLAADLVSVGIIPAYAGNTM